MSDSAERDAELALLKKAAQSLSEHFETIQIFATRHDPNFKGEEAGVTVTMHTGLGNWHARYGQVREWLLKTDEQARIDERNKDD